MKPAGPMPAAALFWLESDNPRGVQRRRKAGAAEARVGAVEEAVLAGRDPKSATSGRSPLALLAEGAAERRLVGGLTVLATDAAAARAAAAVPRRLRLVREERRHRELRAAHDRDALEIADVAGIGAYEYEPSSPARPDSPLPGRARRAASAVLPSTLKNHELFEELADRHCRPPSCRGCGCAWRRCLRSWSRTRSRPRGRGPGPRPSGCRSSLRPARWCSGCRRCSRRRARSRGWRQRPRQRDGALRVPA